MTTETVSILNRFSLAGKTALVTGGGSGIGRSFCRALGEAGAKVAVADIDESTAAEAAAELESRGIDGQGSSAFGSGCTRTNSSRRPRLKSSSLVVACRKPQNTLCKRGLRKHEVARAVY